MEALIAALGVSLAWALFSIWLGPRIGFMDHPDGSDLKTHQRATTPLGGVGVYLGVIVAQQMRGGVSTALLVASTMALILGLVDDRVGLAPVLRLVVEVVIGVVVVVGVVPSSEGVLVIAFGVFLVVFAINAVNLFDGLDGLAASVGAVTALGVAWLAATGGVEVSLPMALAAALAGFLVVGWHPAKVFLGDAGAYVVGLFLAASSLEAASGDGWLVLLGFGLLGVFALDVVVTLLRRLRSGERLFEGDRSHVYDQLRDRGLSVRVVVMVAAGAQAVLLTLAVLVDIAAGPVVAVAIVVFSSLVGLLFLAGAGFLSPQRR